MIAIQSRSRALGVLVTILLAFAVLPAAAADVVRLKGNGPAANRLDLVILGDGYRASEMQKFARDARGFMRAFFREEPFATYAKYFNVARIDTPSKQSGAGENGVSKNTVYGSAFGCLGIQRLLCADWVKIEGVLAANVGTDARDLVLVLVNTPEYGGSGGRYAVSSTHEASGAIAIHEFGHSFGLLDDEYVEESSCGFYTQPWGFNVTQEKKRKKLPWAHLVARSTPLPTPDDSPLTGRFEGAFFCEKGWYRGTWLSKMRALHVPFGPVNEEQLVRRTYAFVDLIDKSAPKAKSVKIARSKPATFKVVPIDRRLSTVSYVWRLGGKVIGKGSSVTVKRGDLKGKSQTLKVTVRDRTSLVTVDPEGDLVSSRTWKLTP